MLITPHFSLAEMVVSQVAARDGLDNRPGPDALANLKCLCEALEQVRSIVGMPIIISSAFRSPELNRRIGGAPCSAHQTGLAADFTAPGMTPRELALCIQGSDIAYDQLILEFDSWVHIAVSRGSPRREVLTIRRGTGYLPGIH